MRRTTVLRIVLLVMAAIQLVPGLWAAFAPANFYASFPGGGVPWVAADGPYNHHLVVDAGAGLLAVGVALVVAAVLLRRPAVLVALAATVAHAVPHAAYHLANPADPLPTAHIVASTGTLLVLLVVAAVLLVVVARGGSIGEAAERSGEPA